jgi:hypothetical protein
LRCSKAVLRAAAARYPVDEDAGVEAIAPAARRRGFLERDEFLALCDWKSRRPSKRYRSNSSALIAEITRVAFGSRQEELKVRVLQVLSGVSWPVASVLLHFCDRARYPILDVRALASVGVRAPSQYTFPFWYAYTEYTRSLSLETGLSMRDLDRGLWQLSKESVGKRGG